MMTPVMRKAISRAVRSFSDMEYGTVTEMTLQELGEHIRSMPEDEILRITFETGEGGWKDDGREHETETV